MKICNIKRKIGSFVIIFLCAFSVSRTVLASIAFSVTPNASSVGLNASGLLSTEIYSFLVKNDATNPTNPNSTHIETLTPHFQGPSGSATVTGLLPGSAYIANLYKLNVVTNVNTLVQTTTFTTTVDQQWWIEYKTSALPNTIYGPHTEAVCHDFWNHFNDSTKVLVRDCFLSDTTPTVLSNTVSTTDNSYHVLADIPGFSGVISNDFKLGDYVATIFKIGIAIAGVLAVVMLIIGGIMHMISELPGQKETGSTMMSNAIFGLLLALGSWAILNTINPDILSLRFVGGVGGAQVATSSGGSNQSGVNNGKHCGTLYPNNSAWPPVGMSVTNQDAAKRASLVGVTVNHSDCSYVGQPNCTSLDGLAQTAITGVNALKTSCGATCDIVITGGTECWYHQNTAQTNTTVHAPGSAVVDLRTDSAMTGLRKYIHDNATSVTTIPWVDAGGNTQYIVGTTKFVDEHNHFHVRQW